MDYEHDGRIGIYIDPLTNGVMLQLLQLLPVHFRDLDELEGLIDHLKASVLAIRSATAMSVPLEDSDGFDAVEEFERIVEEYASDNPVSCSNEPVSNQHHTTGTVDQSTTAAVSSPGIGHDLVDSFWKVTLVGISGRNKTKLI